MLHFMNATGRVRVLLIALFTTVFLSLTACKSEKNYFADESASEGDGDTPNSSTGFRLRLKSKLGVDAFMHKFGDIAAGCEVPLADIDTPTSINCMANFMEYDLWFHGFEYELNVPQGFCEYIEEVPYAYFESEPGRGPVEASITTLDGVITACTADFVAATSMTSTTCTVAEGEFTSTGEFKCIYDYTSPTDDKGMNCCTGRTTLSLTTRTTVLDPPGINEATSSVVIENSGKYTNCIESPMMYDDNWPKDEDGGAMRVVIELGGNQLTRSQKVLSPFKVSNDSKRHTSYVTAFNAGMHDWAAYVADPNTWSANRQRPRPLLPGFDRGANGDWSGGTPNLYFFDGSYNFLCLGAAGEVRHQIKLYVNEWNTVEDYQSFKANGDASAVDPSRRGIAGVNCSAVNTGVGATCNSFWDFQDVIDDPDGANGDATLWFFPDDWRRARPRQ